MGATGKHVTHICHVLCIQHFEIDFLKFTSVVKHTPAVFCRLYLYARNLCRHFHNRSRIIIQPCDSTAVSVCININDFFVLWFRFIGKYDFGYGIRNYSVEFVVVFRSVTISFNLKRHLFRPQIQIPGQLNLRYASIRNFYFLRTRFIRIPRNPGPYRFFITPLHNLPGRVINHHILVSPVCKLQPVSMKSNSISFCALARLFGA